MHRAVIRRARVARELLICLIVAIAAGCSGTSHDAAATAAEVVQPSSEPAPPTAPPTTPPTGPAAGPSTPSPPAAAPQPAGITRYVNPGASAAVDSGTGSSAAPYKTLAYAVKQLQPGDTLLLAAGTYREALDLRPATNLRATNAATATKVTRIAAMTGANVVLKGSDVVSGWEWVRANVFVKRNWIFNSQQVFVNGVALKQIGGTIYNGYPTQPGNSYADILAGSGGIWPGRVSGNSNALVNNSFHYDVAAKSLYIMVPLETLQGQTVEASVRQFVVMGESLRNLTLSNLKIQHSNTTAHTQNGAVTLLGDKLVLEGVSATYADGAGFDITGNDNTLRNVTASYCGQVGIKMRGRNGQLLDSLASYNNTRGFNKWWEAGGAKFVGAGGLQNSLVKGNRFLFNNGDGVWFDYENRDNKVHENVAAYNTGMGIHYEVSVAIEIVRNHIFGNGQRGIYLPNSRNSIVAHNIVVKNGLEGIAIVDERNAYAQNNSAWIPSGGYIVGNVIGWNGKSAVVLPQAAIQAASDANLYAGPQAPTYSQGWATATNPLVVGLTAWLGKTGHDVDSWHDSAAEPTQLAADIAAKKPAPDFTALYALAAKYTIPKTRLPTPVPAVIGARPGPK